ncbi:14267_t:CDS:2 [Ambispora leptoticha]|uniref:EKC/KEOPS complex subunit GON7 n=1 Tax=Ambispora leptoticha TaxID=144679 RepID=A0A9N9D0G7_9GLOM|nr:14267_t:CDS:2 [Ambispora leptoticha]
MSNIKNTDKIVRSTYTKSGTLVKEFTHILPSSPETTTTENNQSKDQLKSLSNTLLILQEEINTYLTDEMKAIISGEAGDV